MDSLPEILIYIQKVMSFIKNDRDSNHYFLSNVDENLFTEHLTVMAEKNFETVGDPTLTEQQFELLRKITLAISISKNFNNLGIENEEPKPKLHGMFVEYPKIGKISLN